MGRNPTKTTTKLRMIRRNWSRENFEIFFVKLFTKKDTVADKKSEEPVKMSNCATKEEFEPEDKPEIPEEDQKLKPEVVETETTKLTEPKEEEQLPKTVLASETSF